MWGGIDNLGVFWRFLGFGECGEGLVILGVFGEFLGFGVFWGGFRVFFSLGWEGGKGIGSWRGLRLGSVAGPLLGV